MLTLSSVPREQRNSANSKGRLYSQHDPKKSTNYGMGLFKRMILIKNSRVREPDSENCFDLIFAAPLSYRRTRYKLFHIFRKFIVGYAKSWRLPKYRPLNLNQTGLRSCEIVWFNLGKNQRSSTEVSLYSLLVH